MKNKTNEVLTVLLDNDYYFEEQFCSDIFVFADETLSVIEKISAEVRNQISEIVLTKKLIKSNYNIFDLDVDYLVYIIDTLNIDWRILNIEKIARILNSVYFFDTIICKL